MVLKFEESHEPWMLQNLWMWKRVWNIESMIMKLWNCNRIFTQKKINHRKVKQLKEHMQKLRNC